MWERVGERTEMQHIDPHSIGHNRVSFPFPGLLNRGPGGPASLGHDPQSSIFSQTGLIPNSSIGGLRAPSAGCWLSLPHLVSNWLNFLCTKLYNSSTTTFLGVTSCTHSTHRQSRLYSVIPRPDAPVIYTGTFPILTAWPGPRSINNTSWQGCLELSNINKGIKALISTNNTTAFSRERIMIYSLISWLSPCNVVAKILDGKIVIYKFEP